MARSGTMPLGTSTPIRHVGSVSVALQVVAGIILVIIAAAAYYELQTTRKSVIDDTARQMSRLDMVFAEQTGRAIEAVDLLVVGAIETVQSQQSSFDGVADTLRRRIKGVRQLASILVVDQAGNPLVSTDDERSATPPAEIASLLARYQADPQAAMLISQPFRIAPNKWNALLARPLRDSDGKLAGLAVGSINLSYFEDFYRAVELNENGSIILHLRDGTVLARFPHVDKAIGTSFGDLPPFTEVLAHGQAGTLLMKSPVDGSIRVTAIRALRAYPLAVMVSVEQGRILVDWQHGALALIGIAVLLGGAVLILLLVLSRRSLQIEQLLAQTNSAKDIAEQSKDRLLEQMAEREKAEGALRQAQRMEAIGQLTGGVAHDFNNLLMVVLGNVDILMRRVAADDVLVSRLVAIRAAAKRGATLTGHLLAFARRQPLMPKPVDLNETIQGMRDLLETALGIRARVQFQLSNDLWAAMVDQSQIELVILNLVINARDAMPDGGLITIETKNRQRLESGTNDGPAAGDYVTITVRDNGTGIAPDVLARVFEPFFTTKAPGAGSGLGLSQVFGTARQSGGEVRVESELGRGTAVTVDLPRATVRPARVAQAIPEEKIIGSEATILLVDDDEPVRAITATMLRDLGYDVRDAASGDAAYAILSQDAGIDILLTDLVMPGMSGSRLASAARELLPDLPIIFISGYADQIDDRLLPDDLLIRKPFIADELFRVIETVLAQRQRLFASG